MIVTLSLRSRRLLLNNSCPLCGDQAAAFEEVRGRNYWLCATCDLVFLDPHQRPGLNEERAEYRLHNNNPQDNGYRQHLEQLTEPLFDGVDVGARALDYGCGPTANISVLMADAGYQVADYDPLFKPIMLNGHFDVIAMSEVAEHLHEPGLAFERLAALLGPGGRLGVMTELRQPEHAFADWYYIRELSHVCFYSEATMRWLAQRHGWTAHRPHERVTLFHN